MVGRRWVLAQVGLLGVLGVLAFPGASSALQPSYTVELTSDGPSPTVLTIQIVSYVWFHNADTVTHSIEFADGSCSADIAPGDRFNCNGNATFPGYAGDYPYTVDGTTQASVKVIPEWRSVTINAKHHGFRHGTKVRLHGTLMAGHPGPPAAFGPRMPVRVFARPRGHKWWYPLAVVMAEPLKKPHFNHPHSVWHLLVQPHGPTMYRVEANSQPEGGQFWERAWSKPFGLYLRLR